MLQGLDSETWESEGFSLYSFRLILAFRHNGNRGTSPVGMRAAKRKEIARKSFFMKTLKSKLFILSDLSRGYSKSTTLE